ncbi:MAG: MFS transporter, partial [Candidatus Nanohaloarchaea archaeon]|nr:MFS transporter [Candidatus Nanohaloarchaea archaeon]
MRNVDNPPLVAANTLRLVYLVSSLIVLQLYMKDLGASPFQVSLLTVVFWTAMLVFAPLWGAVSDASGRRKALMAASVLGAAVIIPFYAYMDTISGVLSLRFLYSVLVVGFPPIALASMSLHTSGESRGEDLAPYHTSRAVGFLIGWGGAVIRNLLRIVDAL